MMIAERPRLLVHIWFWLACAGLAALSPVVGGETTNAAPHHPVGADSMFRIRAVDRKYDLHRPNGCTALVIEVVDWPGNEFGLWLPEAIRASGKHAWGNSSKNAFQEFTLDDRGRFVCVHTFDGLTVTSMLTPDPDNKCLWYRYSFHNTGDEPLHDMQTGTCFHLVDAPQFISLRGSRIWANLDGEWTTTDKVPRDQSPDPRRVVFLREGTRTERTVVPNYSFPHAVMPEAAHHPLLIAESFDGSMSVGIAAKEFSRLSNNNDVILRCLHSSPQPIQQLDPGQTAHQDSVIVFYNGSHNGILKHYETNIEPNWPAD